MIKVTHASSSQKNTYVFACFSQPKISTFCAHSVCVHLSDHENHIFHCQSMKESISFNRNQSIFLCAFVFLNLRTWWLRKKQSSQ